MRMFRGGTRARVRSDRADNVESAIDCIEQALPLMRKLHPPRGLQLLVIMGVLRRELGPNNAARATWRKAMALRERPLSAGTHSETAQRSSDFAVLVALLDLDRGDPEAAAAATLERGRATAPRVALALDDIWLASAPDVLRAPIVRARDTLERLRDMSPLATDGTGPAQVRAWEEGIATTQAVLDAAPVTAPKASPPVGLMHRAKGQGHV